jgi:ribosome-binding factor A
MVRRTPPEHARGFARPARVGSLVREVVAEELERLAERDERLALVTVTAVEVTPDLRHARVYVSSLEAELAIALDEVRGRLQMALARQVRLRRTPRLAFVADPGVRHGARIDEILRRLERRNPSRLDAEP